MPVIFSLACFHSCEALVLQYETMGERVRELYMTLQREKGSLGPLLLELLQN